MIARPAGHPARVLAAFTGALLMLMQTAALADGIEGTVTTAGPAILVHGGAGTTLDRTDEVMPAVAAGWKILANNGSPLDAAIAAAVVLEDNPNFNAGTGSNIRMDGKTIQMDAAVMNQRGDFGAVAVIERVKNPVLVAREVMRTPHLLLAGEGATRFARTLGMPDYDPRCPESIRRYEALQQKLKSGAVGEEWRKFDWKAHWNFPTPLSEVIVPKDTIGAVARDGKGNFAAAVSTGGTSITLYGRVGDVPVMGAGIYAGPAGAVCATGWGEYIVRQLLSKRVYDWIEEGVEVKEAVRRGLSLYPSGIGVGLIAVSATGEVASSNTTMAWAGRTGMRGEHVLRADDAEPAEK